MRRDGAPGLIQAHDAEDDMRSVSNVDADAITYRAKRFAAAKCRKCGAKLYPKSLLEPHLNRHQRKHRWYATELQKLQDTFARMRDIA